jgi:uncharacterized protein YaiL (DUF2058 family)
MFVSSSIVQLNRVDFGSDIDNIPTLISGSAQISDEISGSFNSVSGSIATDIVEVSGSVVTVKNDLSQLSGSFETLNAKTLISGSAQIADEISGSFDSVSGSIATDIVEVSGSVVTVKNDLSQLSGSFETLNAKTLISGSAQISDEISGSFDSVSGSIATDIVEVSGSVVTVKNDLSQLSGSFETLNAKTLISGSAQISDEISGSFNSVSGSIATDIVEVSGSVVTVKNDLSQLSGSFETLNAKTLVSESVWKSEDGYVRTFNPEDRVVVGQTGSGDAIFTVRASGSNTAFEVKNSTPSGLDTLFSIKEKSGYGVRLEFQDAVGDPTIVLDTGVGGGTFNIGSFTGSLDYSNIDNVPPIVSESSQVRDGVLIGYQGRGIPMVQSSSVDPGTTLQWNDVAYNAITSDGSSFTVGSAPSASVYTLHGQIHVDVSDRMSLLLYINGSYRTTLRYWSGASTEVVSFFGDVVMNPNDSVTIQCSHKGGSVGGNILAHATGSNEGVFNSLSIRYVGSYKGN